MKINRFQKNCSEVAVVLDLSGESVCRIMRKILQFIRENASWNITYISSNGNTSTLSSGYGDGMITQLTRKYTYQKILSPPYPTVLLCEESFRSPSRKAPPPVLVRYEELSIGKKGAEYLLKHSFQYFAYISNPVPYAWSRFGILAANDFRGRPTQEACRYSGIPALYQAAVLWSNNDEWVCQIAYPSFSSIAVDWEKAGFLVDSVLPCRMNNMPASMEKFYTPIHVIFHNSTERLHVTAPLVVRIRFVCNLLANSPWTINEIAEHCGFEMQIIWKSH